MSSRGRLARANSGTTTRDLLALRFGAIWTFFTRQDLAFWAMCAYLVVEYVRPQQLISAIYGAPLGQITLGLAIIGFLISGPKLVLNNVVTWLFLAFTAVIVISSVGAYDSTISFNELKEVWLPWVVVFFLIVGVVNTEQRFAFFLLLWLACHYYMSQGGAKQFAGRGFSFATWGIIGAPGWFANSGEFAIAMCMFTFISWRYYQSAKDTLNTWRKVFVLGMPLTAVLGIIGSSSRGAVVGLGAGVAWTIIQGRPKPKTILLAGLVAVFVWIVLPEQQKARFTTAGEDRTSTLRLTYWKAGLDMARAYPTFGIGYGNWLTFYDRNYKENSGGVVEVSHNIFIQCMAELGYIGLAVLIAQILALFAMNFGTRRAARSVRGPPNEFLIHMAFALDAAVVTYVVTGFFVTVLYYPFFWVTLAMAVALNAIARNMAGGPGQSRRADGSRGNQRSSRGMSMRQAVGVVNRTPQPPHS